MTIEELFTEEYKKLKSENEKLKSHLEIMNGMLDTQTKANSEYCTFLHSLKIRTKKSDFSGRTYIQILNNTIFEGDEFYDLISRYAKEESTEDKK